MALSGGVAQAGEDPRDLYLKGKPVLDLRYRFEFVDQDGRPEDAKANTVRTRVGFETGRVHGLGAGFDLEWVESIGAEDFNDTINGKTRFPVVADPDDFALNQLFLVSDGTIPFTRLKIGRQRIVWDNARFIGNVGFRQNEQTFDALRVGTTVLPDTEIGYSYLEEVHRIFGRDSDVGRLGMDTPCVSCPVQRPGVPDRHAFRASAGLRARLAGPQLQRHGRGAPGRQACPRPELDASLSGRPRPSAGLRRQPGRFRPLVLRRRARAVL